MIATPTAYPIYLNGHPNLPPSPPRAPGVHISGVLRAIAMQTSILKFDDEDLATTIAEHDPLTVCSNGTLMRIIMGYAWEQWLFTNVLCPLGVIHQPGELSLDGVYGNTDGVSFADDGAYLLHESKCTFKHAAKSVLNSTLWMWQIMCYLAMMSAKYQEKCTRAVMHVQHIRGYYQGIDPVYIATEVEFEWEEIESTWDMVVRHKHLAREEK